MRRMGRKRPTACSRAREAAVTRQRRGRPARRPRSARRLRARHGPGSGSTRRKRRRRAHGGAPGSRRRAAARRQNLRGRARGGSRRLDSTSSRAHLGLSRRPGGRRFRQARSRGRRRRARRRRCRRSRGRCPRSRTRRPMPRRRLSAQLPDPLGCGRIETGEVAGLDLKAPALNTLQQLRALQSQLFGQLVNSRRQRQLLPGLIPVPRVRRDPGWILDGSGKSLAKDPARDLVIYSMHGRPGKCEPKRPTERAIPGRLTERPEPGGRFTPGRRTGPGPQAELSSDRSPASFAARSARGVGEGAPGTRSGAFCSTASVAIRIPSP